MKTRVVQNQAFLANLGMKVWHTGAIVIGSAYVAAGFSMTTRVLLGAYK